MPELLLGDTELDNDLSERNHRLSTLFSLLGERVIDRILATTINSNRRSKTETILLSALALGSGYSSELLLLPGLRSAARKIDVGVAALKKHSGGRRQGLLATAVQLVNEVVASLTQRNKIGVQLVTHAHIGVVMKMDPVGALTSSTNLGVVGVVRDPALLPALGADVILVALPVGDVLLNRR
jgi:hypothetical protein